VGSCEGTYHYHRGTSSSPSDSESYPHGAIVLIGALVLLSVIILINSKGKADSSGIFYKLLHFIISLVIVIGLTFLFIYLFSG
jgi:hypothetical protein